MAAKVTSFVKARRNSRQFAAVLKYAACEWLLILLLLIDAAFSYLLTKFAHYCELQIPCILCSRLDHVLGNEKPGFYVNLLCSNHRSELSSLISCQIHGKLAHGHGMYEECALSYPKKTKSKPDMHGLVMGEFVSDRGSFPGSFPSNEFSSGSLGIRLCSCCNKPRRSRQTANRILQLKSPRSGMARPDIPLPRRSSHQESLKKMKERFSDGSIASCHLAKCGYDTLSHIGYTELKINSDSESEFPFSDDGEVISIFDAMKEPKEESKIQHISEGPPKAHANDISPEKPTHHSSKPNMKPDIGEPHGGKSPASDAGAIHDLDELNWQQADQNTHSTIPELISLDDFSPPYVMEGPAVLSKEQCELKFPPSQNPNPSVVFDLLSLQDASVFNVVGGPVEASQKNSADSTETADTRDYSINEHEEFSKSEITTDVAYIKNYPDQIEVYPITPTYVDPCGMWKPIICTNEMEANASMAGKPIMKESDRVNEATENTEASGFVAEKCTMKEPDGLSEDLKLSPIENAFAQEVDLYSKNTPSLHGNGDVLQMVDTSISSEVQMLQKSASMERLGSSGLESLEENFVSKIVGENIVDRLKQQVEDDQRCINLLNEELEQERSASAIAANQAMAMITRLQEEKAALNMEALQYLRMMEEQAEYDVEELEKANDLLAEREKEIQDLETELDYFRLNFRGESVLEATPLESFHSKGTNMSQANTGIPYARDDVNVPASSMFSNFSTEAEKSVVVKSSLSGYDDEKLFISQCLKGLERKLHQFSHHGASPYMSDSEYSEEIANGGLRNRESLDKEGTKIHGLAKENSLPTQKDSPVSNGLPANELSIASAGDDEMVSNENNHPLFSAQKSSHQYQEIDLATLANEISDLNERLEALESDWNFLDHTINSLQAGKEGLCFVQEIAHQLQELRKIGMGSRHQYVP